MAEYIEREEAYPLAKKICDAIDSEDFQRLNFGFRILDWIDDLPAADVRPVVKAKWELDSDKLPICSNCGEIALQIIFVKVPHLIQDVRMVKSNFCPNCGADMREESR